MTNKPLTDSQEKNLKTAVQVFKNGFESKKINPKELKNRKQNSKVNSFYGIDSSKFKQAAQIASVNEAKHFSENKNGII